MKMLNRILSALSAVVLIAMMFQIVFNALARFILHTPITGTNELVQYWYLPLVALLGIPAAQIQREHIVVSLLVDRLNPVSGQIFHVFASVLGFAMSCLWAWFGLRQALSRSAVGATAGLTDIPAWPAFFLVPLVFAVLAVLYVREAVLDSRGRNAFGPPTEPPSTSHS